MNSYCNGDRFVRHGRTYGRCFLDSTIFLYDGGMEKCPHCGRPWEPVDPSLTEAELKNGGWGGAVDRYIDRPALLRLLAAARQEIKESLASSRLREALLDCQDLP